MQRNRIELLLSACLLLASLPGCMAQRKQAIISTVANEKVKIPLGVTGTTGSIEYDLRKGSFDVLMSEYYFVDAYAAWGDQDTVKSTQPGKRNYRHQPFQDALGKGNLHIFSWEANGRRFEHLFYVYTGKPWFLVQLQVQGKQAGASYISPITTRLGLPASAADAFRALYVPFDNDMWARFDSRSVNDDLFTGSEVTAIYEDTGRYGFVIGSVEHTVWKTGIKMPNAQSRELAVYGGFTDDKITHDKIPHGKVSINDTLCVSPKIFVGDYNDWRKGMEEYAAVNRQLEPPVIKSWKKATPMGWNSWGAMQTKLTLDKAKAVVDYFADSLKGFRNADNTLYIDLDSYWDNLVKGGLKGDVSQLKAFADHCKQHGLVPGIYWAPFADWGKHARTMEGSKERYENAWILQKGQPVDLDGAYALDPTHPGTKARILLHLNTFKELGYRMIKVDFLGHAALESERFYDPAVTTGMQAYAQGMRFVDSVLDDKMLIYAAISPTMATGRYVHMRRIACDAFSAIDNTEYTLNSTGYGWWQGKLYDYVDADHVVFNQELPGAARARLASALVTGTLITGDDFSEAGAWRSTAQSLLQQPALLQLIRDGQQFRPFDTNTGNKAPQVFVRQDKDATYLALFNYGKTPGVYSLDLSRLDLSSVKKYRFTELFTNQQMDVTGTPSLPFELAPADVQLYKVVAQ